MKCALCKERLQDGQQVIAIMVVVGNEKRGDFVGLNPDSYAHLRHFEQAR